MQFTQSTRRGRYTPWNNAPLGPNSWCIHFLCNSLVELKLCVCALEWVSVCTSILQSFRPLQHSESWKLQPDIHKQWPHKTMQTRCLGSFPCPRVQQLAELFFFFFTLLHPPLPSSNIRRRPRCGFMENTEIFFSKQPLTESRHVRGAFLSQTY